MRNNTLLPAASAFVLTVAASLALGCWAADRITGHAATSAFAVPEFVISVRLPLVPSLWTGRPPAVTLTGVDGEPATRTRPILPVLALVIPQAGWNTRIVRGALADRAATPHVEAAPFDGLPMRQVVLRHALPGAIPALASRSPSGSPSA
ncbi:ABC transporter permease subunit [Streptomyces atratus]|uniref:ABC transporter permease subunit n=1 Tax=Streptomyces atratus TaxID=1893 RepID=UPI002AC345EF|nr:ABC transporter permease subunit [Streptomyces atratus]WPW27538.1 ABC transporter permease subunit [Streptomyces atratus]